MVVQNFFFKAEALHLFGVFIAIVVLLTTLILGLVFIHRQKAGQHWLLVIRYILNFAIIVLAWRSGAKLGLVLGGFALLMIIIDLLQQLLTFNITDHSRK